jgi:hypothetical protein
MSTCASSLLDPLLTTACAGAVGVIKEIPLDLASRHAGAVLGPGSFPGRKDQARCREGFHHGLLAKPTIFGTVSDSPAGDPVANPLAMLEEGCINESVAAAEAAVAALVVTSGPALA